MRDDQTRAPGLVQPNAGDDIGVGNDEYARIGAEINYTPEEIFVPAELVVKVKEPQGGEGAMLASPDFPIPQLSLNQKVREATIG